MIRKVRIIVIVSLVFSVTLRGGWAVASIAEDRKKIVILLDGTPLIVPQTVVALSKRTEANGKAYLSDLLYGLPWIYNKQIQKQIRLVNRRLKCPADRLPLQQAIPLLYDPTYLDSSCGYGSGSCQTGILSLGLSVLALGRGDGVQLGKQAKNAPA